MKPPLAIDIANPKADGTVMEAEVDETVEVVGEVEAFGPVDLNVGAPDIDVASVADRITKGLDAQGEKLDAQAADVQRLTRHLDQLPLVLKEAADIKGQCAQVIKLAGEQASEARAREEAVVEAVNETRRRDDALMEVIKEAKSRDDAVIEAISEAKCREAAAVEAIREAKSRDDAVIEAINAAKDRDGAMVVAVDEAVNKALSGAVQHLGEASSRDAQALEGIQKQLKSNTEAIRTAGEGEEGVSQTLREVLDSSNRIQRVVTEIGESHKGRDAEIAAQFAASKRTMMMLAFACTLGSLLALAVAVIALLK
jgi:hypothetical protein